MKNIKKYLAAFAIALMTGFGVFSVVTAINGQTKDNQQKQNVQKEQKESNDEMNESEENEADEKQNEADENEDGKDGVENEADEQVEQAKLAQEATITRDQAELIALGKIPGTVIEDDLEKENGKLIYGFDIRNSDNQMFDVEVDANTGEILKAQPGDSEDGENEGSETGSK